VSAIKLIVDFAQATVQSEQLSDEAVFSHPASLPARARRFCKSYTNPRSKNRRTSNAFANFNLSSSTAKSSKLNASHQGNLSPI
jgi:hypothetical protein